MKKSKDDTNKGERILKSNLREIPNRDWKYFSGRGNEEPVEDPFIVADHAEDGLFERHGISLRFI